MDTGVGLDLFKIIEKQDEDRRVSAAALAGICNLVNNFSPLRTVSACADVRLNADCRSDSNKPRSNTPCRSTDNVPRPFAKAQRSLGG